MRCKSPTDWIVCLLLFADVPRDPMAVSLKDAAVSGDHKEVNHLAVHWSYDSHGDGGLWEL